MNSKKQQAIRDSLKKTFFNNTRKNLQSISSRQNQSPPIQNVQQSTPNHEFRHFYDIYEYGDYQIGEGANGIVKVCFKKEQLNEIDRITYAVKVFRTGDPEIINTIRETFKLNRQLNDLNCVVRALDLFINSKKEEHHLVMEFCPYPSLESRIGHLQDNEIQQIALNLAQSINSLHQRGVCHRDLKPDNILVGDQFTLKLVDFGVSKRFLIKGKLTKKIDMWTRTGSLFYQAPEIFIGGGYTEKIDIWAAGVILYQLLVGELPFQKETVLDTIELIRDSEINVKSSLFSKLQPLQQDLLKRLLTKDPDKRLSAADFVLHPWLHQANSEIVQQKKSTKSFDDIDVDNQRNSNNILQQSQITYFRQSFARNQNQQLSSIFEEKEQNSSLRNSWINFGNHIHYVPQDVINLMNLNNNERPLKVGTSQDLIQDQQVRQQEEINEFQIGLVRTTSEQFDQL